MNLGDLLQLLGSNGVTGILRIKTPHKTHTGVVYLENGNPVNALVESKSGLEALLTLFGWVDGVFEVNREKISTEKKINKSRMEIILDGMRMLDDGEIERVGEVRKESGIIHAAGSVPIIKGPLIDYMYIVDEETFEAGRRIVEEKKHGNWIWVILSGVIDVYKATSKGKLTLVRLGEGAFLGSLAAFTVEGNTRSASAVAAEPVQLGVIDIQRLFAEFSVLPYNFKEFMLSMDRRLRQVTARLTDMYLNPNAEPSFFQDWRPFVGQAEKMDILYRIQSGCAAVAQKIPGGHVPLAYLAEGDYFGRIPFLELGQEPGSAAVLAPADNFKANAVDSERFQKMHEQLSPTLKKFLENIANCISVTTMRACQMKKRGVEP